MSNSPAYAAWYRKTLEMIPVHKRRMSLQADAARFAATLKPDTPVEFAWEGYIRCGLVKWVKNTRHYGIVVCIEEAITLKVRKVPGGLVQIPPAKS